MTPKQRKGQDQINNIPCLRVHSRTLLNNLQVNRDYSLIQYLNLFQNHSNLSKRLSLLIMCSFFIRIIHGTLWLDLCWHLFILLMELRMKRHIKKFATNLAFSSFIFFLWSRVSLCSCWTTLRFSYHHLYFFGEILRSIIHLKDTELRRILNKKHYGIS